MKKLMIIMLLFAFGLTTYNAEAQAEKTNDEYKKELAKYYKLSGQDASIATAVDGIMDMMSSIPEVNKLNLKKDLFEKMIKETMESFAPVYEKNISLADLKAMNKFYSEGAGKRIGEAMPKMAKEILTATMSMAPKMQKMVQEAMGK